MSGAPHPRMHGITHVTGGPDPIPGLLPPTAVDYPGVILATPCLTHYWPADETSGDLVDRKGSSDLTRTTHVDPVDGVTLWPQYGAPGPFDGAAVANSGYYSNLTVHEGCFNGSAGLPNPFTLELWLYLTEWPHNVLSGETVELGFGTVVEFGSFGIYVGSNSPVDGGSTSRKLYVNHSATLVDPDEFPMLAWQHIAVRHDGATIDLLRNGTVRDSVASAGGPIAGGPRWLNNDGTPARAPWNGYSAHLAIYDCALSDATIVAHSNMLAASETGGSEGDVLTIDNEGNPVWVPPPAATMEWEDV